MAKKNLEWTFGFVHIRPVLVCKSIIRLNVDESGPGERPVYAGMGHGYSGSVSESQSPIFLQAMGRRTKEEGRSNPGRQNVG